MSITIISVKMHKIITEKFKIIYTQTACKSDKQAKLYIENDIKMFYNSL